MLVYVDGQSGTTGLKIHERLAHQKGIELLKIDEDKRKDTAERKKLMNEADIVFLCLPDAAAIEAVSLIEPNNTHTRILDTSTAHRTSWVYGLPELSPMQKERIQNAKRVAVPGCYATAFILPLYPLVQKGIVARDMPITSYGLSGYSGGGKTAIAEYANKAEHPTYIAPRIYGLGLTHKHLPEMQKIVGLDYAPIFSPIINPYYNGLAVATLLHTRLLPKKVTPQEIHALLEDYYKEETYVHVMPYHPTSCEPAYLGDTFFSPLACNETNNAEIFVCGNENQILLLCRLDNLGKGASGAAIQNMHLMLSKE